MQLRGSTWHCSKRFLREPDLALEEACSGLQCFKIQLQREPVPHIGVAIPAPGMAAKV